MAQYELKITGERRTVIWEGASGEAAALRYMDAHQDQIVAAWRDYPHTNYVTIGVPVGLDAMLLS